MADRYRILIADPGKRWQVGEIGVAEPLVSEKYAVRLRLEGTVKMHLWEEIEAARVFMFTADEVEKVDEERYERDKSFNPREPEGSYGCCWKYLVPADPGSLRCVLKPGHDGDCSPDDSPDDPLLQRAR